MNLYERHNYLNKSIEYLINTEIVEYDIKSAGFNIIKKFKLLDDSKIEHLESLDRKSRQISIGLYQKYNSEFTKKLNSKFVEIRKIFFEANDIKDEDVLSIKKDAIITLKRYHNTIFDNIEFVNKNNYTSYFYINKFEFYVNNKGLDIKGIGKDKLKLHEPYMIDFLYKIFRLLETNSNKIYIINQLKDFTSYYKSKDLHIGYYRELNNDSLYKLNEEFLNDYIGMEYIDTLNDVDISYNYMKYIIPIINILL